MQDTGAIQAISEGPPDVSFGSMATRQQALADVILKNPAVASLTSFIGVDGTNQTPNSGRFLINLKPQGERPDVQTVIAQLQQAAPQAGPGTALYLQPVQDLTVDATVGRGQYRLVMENPDVNQLGTWVPKLVDKMRGLPEVANPASDLDLGGSTLSLVIDRATAARFGITPATVDNALYDAFGQRIVSTIYTQNNQYRVILEADPSVRENGLAGLSAIYSAVGDGDDRPGPALGHRASGGASRRAADLASRPVSGGDDHLRRGGRVIARRGGQRHRAGRDGAQPAGELRHPVRGRGGGVPDLDLERAVPAARGDRDDVHRAGRAL